MEVSSSPWYYKLLVKFTLAMLRVLVLNLYPADANALVLVILLSLYQHTYFNIHLSTQSVKCLDYAVKTSDGRIRISNPSQIQIHYIGTNVDTKRI